MSNLKILLPCLVCFVSALIALNPHQDQEKQQEPSALSPRELVIMYAKTRMELAQIEFDLASESLARAISKSKTERIRTELAVAKEQYKQALSASSGGVEKVRLAHAAEQVRLARLDRDAVNNLVNGRAASKFAHERAELKYKLAQIKLQLLENPENYVTLIEAMQAQIDQMSQEILALDLRLTQLEFKS